MDLDAVNNGEDVDTSQSQPVKEGEVVKGEEQRQAFIPDMVKKVLSISGTHMLFQQREQPNAINTLVQPGDDPVKILMRTSFPSREVRIAGMHIMTQCEEFEDKLALAELFYNMAGTVSEKNGQGRRDLIQAIIGDRVIKQGGISGAAGNVGDWLKNKAFGRQNDNQQ